MGRWGNPVTINGIEFVPHIETKGFKNTKDSDIIDDLYVIGAPKGVTFFEIEEAKKKMLASFIIRADLL